MRIAIDLYVYVRSRTIYPDSAPPACRRRFRPTFHITFHTPSAIQDPMSIRPSSVLSAPRPRSSASRPASSLRRSTPPPSRSHATTLPQTLYPYRDTLTLPHSRTAQTAPLDPRGPRNTQQPRTLAQHIQYNSTAPAGRVQGDGHTLAPVPSPFYSADVSQTPARSDLIAASPTSLGLPQPRCSENATRSWSRRRSL